ncbi:MAG: heparan-alpha-glucosaminide N-acetyltransferase [Candidatus Aminicenantales bacterium]
MTEDQTEKTDAPAGPRQRIWEIDFLRGVAIILVIGYHLLFDLGEFVGIKRFLGWSTNLSSVAWTIAQHFFAGLFVLLSGTSCTLARSNVRRGLRLLAVSFAVTVVTYIFDPTSAIYFGILQCLAVSMLLYGAAFEKAGAVACAAWGTFVLGLTAVLPTLRKIPALRTDWLLPFGLTSPSFYSFDYFPLVPWLGIFLIGVSLGKSVYASKRSLLPWRLPKTFVNWAGRHSLIIYIAHQPIIMGVLYIFGLSR